MLLTHHATGRMCVTSTVFFFLILPASFESFVQHWIATKPVELGCLDAVRFCESFFLPFLLVKTVLVTIVPKEFSRDREAVESGHHPRFCLFSLASGGGTDLVDRNWKTWPTS